MKEIRFRVRTSPELRVEGMEGPVESLTGYLPQDFAEDPDLIWRLAHADDAPVIQGLLSHPAAFQAPLVLRWRNRRGEWVWMEIHQSPVLDGGHTVGLEGVARWIGPGVDRLPAREAPLTLDVATLLDEEGVIRSIGPNVRDLLGYEMEELIGRDAFELLHPGDHDEIRGVFDALREEPFAIERRLLRVRHRDGTWRVIESVAESRVNDPHVMGVVLYSRDVTQRERLVARLREGEEALRRLVESRARVVGDLLRLQDSKERMSRLLVHDLKSPLTVVLAAADRLLKRARSDQEGPLEDILLSAESMSRLISNALDVSRGEREALEPALSELELERFLAGVAERMERLARYGGQSLEVERRSERARIVSDPDLLGRTLANLLDNASRHSPRGAGIRLVVEDRGRDRVLFQVVDQGGGVPPSERERIFDLYARSAGEEAAGSHGIGLAFCRMAAEALGGRIWVEPDPAGRGSRFCVELPATPQ